MHVVYGLINIIYRAPRVANSYNHFLLHAAVHRGVQGPVGPACSTGQADLLLRRRQSSNISTSAEVSHCKST